MTQVLFWSPVPGQTANSSNLIAVSSIIGLEYALRILVASKNSAFEHVFMKRSSLSKQNLLHLYDSGIDALTRLYVSGRLKPETVQDYTQSILKDNLDLLTVTTKAGRAGSLENRDTLQPILHLAKQVYDFTIIDAGHEKQNERNEAFMENSDLVVVNLNQNKTVLDGFFNKRSWPTALKNKPILLNIGRYDSNSKYTAAGIARNYKWKNPIYTVPQCTDFMDACNDRHVLDFFIRHLNINRQHPNYRFIQEVRRLSRAILIKKGIHTKQFCLKGA